MEYNDQSIMCASHYMKQWFTICLLRRLFWLWYMLHGNFLIISKLTQLWFYAYIWSITDLHVISPEHADQN